MTKVATWLRLFLVVFVSVAGIGIRDLAFSADISVTSWRGHRVLRLSGEIDDGTEKKLETSLDSVAPLPYGLAVLLLDSPGGLVGEAMSISELLDRKPVHTVIPNGAKCASACASIVFIAGKNRTIEEGGLLGQHSCSRDGVPDEECNELLSRHAVEHGVSHGSVKAFVTYVSPENILWFTRADAEGWGLTKYPGEDLSGFEKSEPRVIALLAGKTPPAQSAWRIDFREDGFKAFVRTVSDFEREMQLNLYCSQEASGHLFLTMDVTGPLEVVSAAVIGVSIVTDHGSWNDDKPVVRKLDEQMTEVVTEVPTRMIKPFLKSTDQLVYGIGLRKPYSPMIARTWLGKSRKVLLFAANHCSGLDVSKQ